MCIGPIYRKCEIAGDVVCKGKAFIEDGSKIADQSIVS